MVYDEGFFYIYLPCDTLFFSFSSFATFLLAVLHTNIVFFFVL